MIRREKEEPRKGAGYGNLDHAYNSFCDYGKATEYDKNICKVQKKSVIVLEKEQPMEILVLLTSHWDYEKAIE